LQDQNQGAMSSISKSSHSAKATNVPEKSTYSKEIQNRYSKKIRWACSQFYILVLHAAREALRNKSQYALGFSVVFIVVIISSLLMAITSYSNVTFLSLAEYFAGELDMILQPSPSSKSQFINYTHITTLLQEHQKLSSQLSDLPFGIYSPRAPNIAGSYYASVNCNGFNQGNPTEPSYPYLGYPMPNVYIDNFQNDADYIKPECRSRDSCLDIVCNERSISSNVYFIDFENENAGKIGDQFPFDSVPEGSVILQSDLAYNLNVKEGDFVFLSLTM
jgi:hypothetical protein